MGSSSTRKSSNEHGFFIVVTSLNKFGEWRIRDLTDDILFSVTFKCAMLIVIRKDLRHYWCIMSNNVLMGIDNRAELPRPYIEVLTSQVLANRKAGRSKYPPMDVAKTLEPTPTIWPRPVRNKKPKG